ncbi:hypothetical protein Hbl1158_10300 [Halobaculum sp. CBA1158]|uniref:hypothetical protein n=1 Tax=Halobaculum sp. CBA1158 TaxID=2904243 RepID=UPI001F219E67|nr:hypothetical protein [Halobaculum sp. CBA1158]UIO98925.1 hypothetical protein Hbl1158_10300 [Halobaculum sp. CBA1158]
MSNAIRGAAERLSTEGTCPACGADLVDGQRPPGYDDPHCAWCAAQIEDRHTWHARRDGLRGGR